MHWDIEGITDEDSQDLESYLNQSNTYRTPVSITDEGRPRSYAPSSHSSDSHSSDTRSTVSQTSNSHHSSSGSDQDAITPASTPEPEEGRDITEDHTFERINSSSEIFPRYLEICINTGQYSKVVEEINITDVKSDGELFTAIAQTYYKARAERAVIRLHIPEFCSRWFRQTSFQWSMMKPNSFIFRKVVLPLTHVFIC